MIITLSSFIQGHTVEFLLTHKMSKTVINTFYKNHSMILAEEVINLLPKELIKTNCIRKDLQERFKPKDNLISEAAIKCVNTNSLLGCFLYGVNYGY